MKWILLAWQNLGRNRRRTLATLLLIAMGVTGIMTTTGFALYTYESLQEFAMRENGQLILSHPDFFEREEEFPLQLGVADSDDIRATLLKDLNVSYVLPSIEFNGLISNGEKTTIFMGRGVDTDLPKVMGPALNIVDGRALSLRPDPAQDYEVILGQGLAESMQASIGSGLTLMSTTSDGALNAIDVIVQGIVATGIPEMDARYLMVHNSSAQFLLDTDNVSQLSIYLRNSDLQSDYQQRLTDEFPHLLVTPWQDRAFFYRSVKNLYDRIFGVMGVVILIMVLFAIFNTSAMSVMERIREIGTLGALGTRRSEIIRLFLLEASLLGGLGTLLGYGLSGILTIALTVFDVQMPAPPGQTEGYPLQVYFSGEVALWALFGVVVISMLASALAVRKGTQLTVAEALRYA
ncbi:FtsX-like permease family protein [Reinekea sp. G2M2-21]|uniref:ABC transporter permease n=1 Tax=Reinekea sp. G2M2-21 TaxID=2788942 RepID=UPI0018AC8D8E|nr:FtsX-like permease family protein [Reinekea sp. G2M2-21]